MSSGNNIMFSSYISYLFWFNAPIHGQNLKSMLDISNVPNNFIIALKQQVEPTIKISYADLQYNIMN
jgi:hypothetical protein